MCSKDKIHRCLLFVAAFLSWCSPSLLSLLLPSHTAAWSGRPAAIHPAGRSWRTQMATELVGASVGFYCISNADAVEANSCSDGDDGAIGQQQKQQQTARVPVGDYYGEYHGHTIQHLETTRKALSEGSSKGGDDGCHEIVYLMGDSTLDNKHWLFLDDLKFSNYPSKEAFLLSNDDCNNVVSEAINGYEDFLEPPKMVMDVCYWMNKLAPEAETGKKICTINAAVEESTVSNRSNDTNSQLLPQDEFVSKNIRPGDTLIVSMGGNDLALVPSEKTQSALQSLARSSHDRIKSGTAAGFDHILEIFHTQVEDFVARVIEGSASSPKKIIVCSLYYLDESSPSSTNGEGSGSWADPILEALGYSDDPTTVQLILKSIHEHLKERGFRLPSKARGTTIVKLFPMFEVLDGKNTNDYVQRVEPSIIGGQKIARGLLELIL